MKTVDHLVIVIAAVLYAASCSVAEAPEIVVLPSECPVFEASIEDDADTKVFADSHLKILWHADDRISIFNKNTYNNQYKFDGETGDNAGSFTHIPNNTFVTGNALDNVYAVYPYSEKSSISNSGVLKVELPAKQSYAAGSFGRGANAMVAVTGDNMLIFKNVCGYFLFQLYGKDLFVSSISLKATGGEALAGVANVTVDSEGVPSAELVSETSSEVVLECDPPQPLGPDRKSVV